MQIPINKDIRRYQEEIFMGLTLRQLLCSGIAIGLAVLIYLWAKPLLGQETASWLCILAAAPIAAAGFSAMTGYRLKSLLSSCWKARFCTAVGGYGKPNCAPNKKER